MYEIQAMCVSTRTETGESTTFHRVCVAEDEYLQFLIITLKKEILEKMVNEEYIFGCTVGPLKIQTRKIKNDQTIYPKRFNSYIYPDEN